MKKISEMTMEELQDYALTFENEREAWKQEKEKLNGDITELNGLNKELQRRNNDLFMKVEQGTPEQPKQEEEQKPVETCEDFAKNLILGDKK